MASLADRLEDAAKEREQENHHSLAALLREASLMVSLNEIEIAELKRARDAIQKDANKALEDYRMKEMQLGESYKFMLRGLFGQISAAAAHELEVRGFAAAVGLASYTLEKLRMAKIRAVELCLTHLTSNRRFSQDEIMAELAEIKGV